ncbi:hypothetical protein ACFQVC_19960 [Streptomyces monticola]|uniref:Lipoprotein n=1 Tax=Streptomyces monticola TaxID=2666263 RepID=A0ABW2JM45_9ACTN
MRRHGPHRTATFALFAALLAPAVLSGCTDAGGAAGSSPSPRATSDTEICVNLVSYWAKQVLDDRADSGRDFMQKGLSNGQNNILIAAVAAAEAEKKRHGTAAAHKVIDRQVKRKCAERYRHGKPSEGIWRDPTPSSTSR